MNQPVCTCRYQSTCCLCTFFSRTKNNFPLFCLLVNPIEYFAFFEVHFELVNRVTASINQKSVWELFVNSLYFVFAFSVIQSSSAFPSVQCDIHLLR